VRNRPRCRDVRPRSKGFFLPNVAPRAKKPLDFSSAASLPPAASVEKCL
jgi:hypothetical protein